MTFGDTVDFDGAAAMLDAALDAGITHIDTANGYAGGDSERILAKLLDGRRDRVTVATKAGIPHPDAGDHSPLSPAGLRASVDGSLARLGTDHVDLFYLHQPDRAASLAETLGTVAELVAEGKIGALGVSNYAAWQIAEVNHTADDVGAPRPIVAQQLYNLLARRIEEEYVEFAAVTGLTTMVYNPLGGGLLDRAAFVRLRSRAEGRFGNSRLAAMYKRTVLEHRDFRCCAAVGGDRRQGRHTADRAGVALAGDQARGGPDPARRVEGGAPAGRTSRRSPRGRWMTDVVDACDDVGAALRGPMPNYNR